MSARHNFIKIGRGRDWFSDRELEEVMQEVHRVAPGPVLRKRDLCVRLKKWRREHKAVLSLLSRMGVPAESVQD